MEEEMQDKENNYQRLELKSEFYRQYWLTKETPKSGSGETQTEENSEPMIVVEKYVEQIEKLETKIAEITKKNKKLNQDNKELAETAEERKNKNMEMITEMNKIKTDIYTLKEEKKSLNDINCMLELEVGNQEGTGLVKRSEAKNLSTEKLESEVGSHKGTGVAEEKLEDEKPSTEKKHKTGSKKKSYRTYECRYGSRCTRADCWFDHPKGRNEGELNRSSRNIEHNNRDRNKRSREENTEGDWEKGKGWLGTENCEFARDEDEDEKRKEKQHNKNNQTQHSSNENDNNQKQKQQDKSNNENNKKQPEKNDERPRKPQRTEDEKDRKDREPKTNHKDTGMKAKTECWYGERCRRTDCKFSHGGTESNGNKKSNRDERYPRRERYDQEKKKPEKTEGKHPRYNQELNETNPFLQETVAQIAGMLINIIQQTMGDVRPLNGNPNRQREHKTKK